ncbi:MAG: hypothetical protein ACOYYJ_13150 [Chloroflexota bacterium]
MSEAERWATAPPTIIGLKEIGRRHRFEPRTCLTEPFETKIHPQSFYSQYFFEVFRDTPLLSELAISGQNIHRGFSR